MEFETPKVALALRCVLERSVPVSFWVNSGRDGLAQSHFGIWMISIVLGSCGGYQALRYLMKFGRFYVYILE